MAAPGLVGDGSGDPLAAVAARRRSSRRTCQGPCRGFPRQGPCLLQREVPPCTSESATAPRTSHRVTPNAAAHISSSGDSSHSSPSSVPSTRKHVFSGNHSCHNSRACCGRTRVGGPTTPRHPRTRPRTAAPARGMTPPSRPAEPSSPAPHAALRQLPPPDRLTRPQQHCRNTLHAAGIYHGCHARELCRDASRGSCPYRLSRTHQQIMA